MTNEEKIIIELELRIKMRDVCCDCKYCKIVIIDSIFARYYCKKNIFQKDDVTGIIDYLECSNAMRHKCKDFQPTLITKIYNFFHI